MTSDLDGMELTKAVAKLEGWNPQLEPLPHWVDRVGLYHEDWRAAGPIIEREHIQIIPQHAVGVTWGGGWAAAVTQTSKADVFYKGSTPLIAAMRAFVASKT